LDKSGGKYLPGLRQQFGPAASHYHRHFRAGYMGIVPKPRREEDKDSQEELAALVRAESGLAVAAAVHGGIDGAGILDSEFSGRARQGRLVAGRCHGRFNDTQTPFRASPVPIYGLTPAAPCDWDMRQE